MKAKAPAKAKYRFTVRLDDREHAQAYTQRELSFLGGKNCPAIPRFVAALGLWDNFSVPRGMNATAWTRKNRVDLSDATEALLAEIDAKPALYVHDYWYRIRGERRMRDGFGTRLVDGEPATVEARRPGQLFAEGIDSGRIEDLREKETFDCGELEGIIVVRAPNEIDWASKLRPLAAFPRSCPQEFVDVNHGFA